MANQIIFDFGSNVGQNLEYFLSRCDKVIAVEANPRCCKAISEKFESEISKGRLIVENVLLVDDHNQDLHPSVEFWVHNYESVLSSINRPKKRQHEYSPILVPAMTPIRLVRKYMRKNSELLYIKSDLEGGDYDAISNLLRNGIFPKYLSIEIQNLETLALVIGQKNYLRFQLIDGDSVTNFKWFTENGFHKVFDYHSSGPFGADLPSNWWSRYSILQLALLKGFGWRDLHATSEPGPTMSEVPKMLWAKKIARKMMSIS
jgi:FkbM family methyltransferase